MTQQQLMEMIEVALPSELLAELREAARRHEKTLEEMICYALEGWLYPGIHGADGT